MRNLSDEMRQRISMAIDEHPALDAEFAIAVIDLVFESQQRPSGPRSFLAHFDDELAIFKKDRGFEP